MSHHLPDDLYAELRCLATSYLRSERQQHTLQATALTHEVFLKLSKRLATSEMARADFLAAAAQAMRRILVDYARARNRIKRGNPTRRSDIDLDLLAIPEQEKDSTFASLEELDVALNELNSLDPEAAQLVSLRFFGGLSVDDAAANMNISPRTAARLWQFSRAWLFDALTRRE